MPEPFERPFLSGLINKDDVIALKQFQITEKIKFFLTLPYRGDAIIKIDTGGNYAITIKFLRVQRKK